MPVGELRIHGVSGSPGPKLLGFESSADTELIAPLSTDTGMCVVRRRRRAGQQNVEGFDWGAINSTSWRVAVWVFLLPFSLLNAAGWMLPAEQKSRLHPSRLLVRLIGLTLTATWTLWLTNVLVNYVAFQTVSRVVEPARTYPVLWWHHTWKDPRRDLVIAAFVIVLALVSWVAYRSWRASDRAATRPAFFGDESAWLSALPTHLAVALGCVVASAAPAYDAVQSPSFDAATNHLLGIDMAGLVLGCGAIQTAFAALLWVTAAAVPRVRGQAHGPAAATASLACLLTGGLLSGGALWITANLPKLLNVPFHAEGRGSDLGSADYYGWALLAGVVMAWLAVVVVKRRAPTTPVSPDLFPRWRKTVPKRERWAYVSRRFDLPLSVFALFAGLVLVGLGFRNLTVSDHGLDLQASSSGVMSNLARWALPLAAAGAVAFSARNILGRGNKKLISIVWDVLTFFPRDYHPLAVRCYAVEVVPRFVARIAERTSNPADRLLLSAHSQGSIITYAALHGLPCRTVRKLAIVTYGCPIVTLYGRNFPAKFNLDRSQGLNALVGGRWHNFFRFSDPIGGPVFASDERSQQYSSQDHRLADPAILPPVYNADDAPLEHDREPQMYLAVHSFYLREQQLKARVSALRASPW